MQKKYIIFLLLSVLFIGCSRHYQTYDTNTPNVKLNLYGPYPIKNKTYKRYDVSIQQMPKDLSRNPTATAYAVLEATAKQVLKQGRRYFSIIYPQRLAHSSVHDLKTFQDTCIEHSYIHIGSIKRVPNSNSCGLTQQKSNYYGFKIRNYRGSISYVMYQTPPQGIVTWDAKRLLQEMDKEGLLLPRSYEWMDIHSKKLIFKD